MDKAFTLRSKGRNITESYNDIISIDDIKYLTKNERWTLYDALRTCKGTFGTDINQEILAMYNNEMNQKYQSISENRIIKKSMEVFNLDEAIFLQLYEAITKKLTINIRLEGKINLNRILPSRIYLDEEEGLWYLEHVRGGEPFAIDLKKVKEVELLPDLKRIQTRETGCRERKREIHRVKIRVFNEKNSRERAIGFLSSKYIVDEKECYGYSDITANIINVDVFKKWVMEMIPQVLILEPMELRQQFIEMVSAWEKNYLAGI